MTQHPYRYPNTVRRIVIGSEPALLLSDALFELTDALACGRSPVRGLAHLSLEAEHRRGHGALYDAIGAGRIDEQALR